MGVPWTRIRSVHAPGVSSGTGMAPSGPKNGSRIGMSENIHAVATIPKTMRKSSTGAVDWGTNQKRSQPSRVRASGAVIEHRPAS